MLRALNLQLSPEAAWQKAALKPPHPLWVLFISILPLMIAGLATEAYGLSNYGDVFGEMGLRAVSRERVIAYTLFYAVASLVVVFIGAAILKNVGESFNLRSTYGTCFVLMAFAYSPVFLSRFLDALPAINTWICWVISLALSLRILYHGVAWWLKPEQTKGFGLFLLSFIYVLVLSGLVHFAAIQVLQGRFLKNVLQPAPTPVEKVEPPRV